MAEFATTIIVLPGAKAAKKAAPIAAKEYLSDLGECEAKCAARRENYGTLHPFSWFPNARDQFVTYTGTRTTVRLLTK